MDEYFGAEKLPVTICRYLLSLQPKPIFMLPKRRDSYGIIHKWK